METHLALPGLHDGVRALHRQVCRKEVMSRILATYHHSIEKRKLHLARWSPSMVDLEPPKSVAIWVRLKNIPFHLWSRNILFAPTSTFGKPLRLDEKTASQRFLSYARVLVVVDLSKTLPTSIGMDIEGENPLVEFKNLPCSSCLQQGHIASVCPKKSGRNPTAPTAVSPSSKLAPPPKPAEACILGPPLPPSGSEVPYHSAPADEPSPTIQIPASPPVTSSSASSPAPSSVVALGNMFLGGSSSPA